MILKETNLKDSRESVLAYLSEQRFEKVLDVGGIMNPWADKFVTHYFDCQITGGKKCFVGDVNDYNAWRRLVKDFGTFDFAVCTHLIEDIRDPAVVLQMLPEVAAEGFIAVPCKYAELCKEIECSTEHDMAAWGFNAMYRGYFHHRWIYAIQDGILVAYPKLGFLDHMQGLEWATLETKNKFWHEMSFWWEDDIPFRILNDDFLGPDGPTVFNLYRETLRGGL